jgi:serine protease Do
MKKSKILLSTLVALVLGLACFGAVGCADSPYAATQNEDPAVKEITVVSYEQTESTVYSTTAQVVANVADTVVEIQTESVTTAWGRQYIVSGAGSGVIVGKSEDAYYIVTNNHVISGANNITITTRSLVSYPATLVATDDSADIAVVKIITSDVLALATWGDSDDLQVGEDLIAIGNPLGSLGGTVTKGILSATSRNITVGNYTMKLLQTDTAINPGNSGGGLFNMRGQLIGIVNAKTTDEEIEGICFAIPGNYAKNVYNDLMQYGYILGRATLGIELAESTLSSGGINAQSQSIVYVTAVSSAPADTFRLYDRIYSINGKTVSSIVEYNAALSTIEAGQSVQVEVYRGTLNQSYWGNTITFDSAITTFTVTAAQYGA